jgi:hypothetical protein
VRKFGPANAPAGILVDQEWYLAKYPDVKAGIKSGKFKSAYQHFIECGYREGRVPRDQWVDEAWYLATYPDVAEAIRAGRFKDARDHFMQNGYGEGRKPNENGM